VTDQIRRAYRDGGVSIAAPVREHGVSRVAIRTAIADLLPGQPEQPAPAAAVTVCRRDAGTRGLLVAGEGTVHAVDRLRRRVAERLAH
jgi:hypothetical protein